MDHTTLIKTELERMRNLFPPVDRELIRHIHNERLDELIDILFPKVNDALRDMQLFPLNKKLLWEHTAELAQLMLSNFISGVAKGIRNSSGIPLLIDDQLLKSDYIFEGYEQFCLSRDEIYDSLVKFLTNILESDDIGNSRLTDTIAVFHTGNGEILAHYYIPMKD